jgi:Flp pilus assembly protein TadG
MSVTDKAVSPAPKRRGGWSLKRFAKDQRGSTAIEFVLLIFPFTLMMFAVIETGLSFGAQQVMSNATDDVARSFRVGELRPGTASFDDIRSLVCNEMSILVSDDCPGLEIDLQTYTDFSTIPLDIPRTGDGDLDTSGFGYNPGASGTVNQIRVFYSWPVYLDFMRKYLAEMPGGNTLLYSTLTWKNEPFL